MVQEGETRASLAAEKKVEDKEVGGVRFLVFLSHVVSRIYKENLRVAVAERHTAVGLEKRSLY